MSLWSIIRDEKLMIFFKKYLCFYVYQTIAKTHPELFDA